MEIRIGEQANVIYAGISYDQTHLGSKGESIYLAELDLHFPELTLGQIISFAASTLETGKTSDDGSKDTGRDGAALFGLLSAVDTKMGSAMIRGVAKRGERALQKPSSVVLSSSAGRIAHAVWIVRPLKGSSCYYGNRQPRCSRSL